MLLAHAERATDSGLKLKLTRGGILLQALMSLQLREGGVNAIRVPSEEEIAHITDTSLTGPYFSSPVMQEALAELEALHQADNTEGGGPGCATPSLDQVAAYFENPKWRVWRKNALPGHSTAVTQYTTDADLTEAASGVQAMDDLPPGEYGFRAQFSRYNGGRRLFVTGREQFLGLGPMSMKVGDEVWVLKGSKVPFLLRKIGDEEAVGTNGGKGKGKPKIQKMYYKYIGDLYVHGIMHGEAVEAAGEWEKVVLIQRVSQIEAVAAAKGRWQIALAAALARQLGLVTPGSRYICGPACRFACRPLSSATRRAYSICTLNSVLHFPRPPTLRYMSAAILLISHD